MTQKLKLTADQILAVAKLPSNEHKQWVQTAEIVLDRPRTGFGRLFRPAETERKLVLFTLSIVVLTILIGTMWYAATEQAPSDALITGLTTLAGTGLGFIGGMVTGNKEDKGSD